MLTAFLHWLGTNAAIFLAAGLSAVVTTILSASYQGRVQRRHAAREAHLRAIKEEVLKPLADRVDQYLLPPVQMRLGPVTIRTVPIDISSSITEPRRAWGMQLAPQRGITERWFPLAEIAEELAVIDPELYADAKENHFPDLLEEEERLVRAVETYLEHALDEASELVKTISLATKLPRADGRTFRTMSEWIIAEEFAVFVLNWRLGAIASPPMT